MTITEQKVDISDLISFEEIAKEHKKGEYFAVGDNGKLYNASYVPEYEPLGVMLFCIPSDIKILGYLKNINAYCNKTIPCCGCADYDTCEKIKEV